MLTSPEVPFPQTAALIKRPCGDSVPGRSDIATGDFPAIDDFIDEELSTPILDELYPRLWIVARKSGASINSLHQHRARGREVMPNENPKMHLVWRHNMINIKPLPECLLDYAFWEEHLCPGKNKSNEGIMTKRLMALGFVRSYAYLIRHRSDFALALSHNLIPNNITWDDWCRFICYFRDIQDSQVAQRYHYGQMRLSRLNWAVRLFRPESAGTAIFYEIPHWSTSEYLERAIGPLVFVFASLSVSLSSMQVVLTAPTEDLGLRRLDSAGVQVMKRAFWVFSMATLFLCGLVWVLITVIPPTVLGCQVLWGFNNRKKRIDVSRP